MANEILYGQSIDMDDLQILNFVVHSSTSAPINVDTLGGMMWWKSDAHDLRVYNDNDSTWNSLIQGPASSTNLNIPTWNGTEGNKLNDGLSLVTTLDDPGSDTNVVSEAGIRTAIDSITIDILGDISDVTITDITNNEILVWETDHWENQTIAENNIVTFDGTSIPGRVPYWDAGPGVLHDGYAVSLDLNVDNDEGFLARADAIKAYVDASVLAEDFWDRDETVIYPRISGDDIELDGNIYLNTDITVAHTDKFIYWGDATDGWDTYIGEQADDVLSFSLGGTIGFKMYSTHFRGNGAAYVPRMNAGLASATVPGFTFDGDESTGIGKSGNNEISFISGGGEKVRVTASDLKVDVVNELNTDAGVTVEAVELKDGGITLATGATVNEIEAALTDDDTHLPTSGAVVDAITAVTFWQRVDTTLSPVNAGDDITTSGNVSSTSATTGQSTIGLGLVVNNLSSALTTADFLVKSSTYNAIFVDASNDSVVIMSNALGKLGFFGAATTVQSTGWAVTNHIADKIIDANATTVDEIVDVLGELITELKLKGILGG